MHINFTICDTMCKVRTGILRYVMQENVLSPFFLTVQLHQKKQIPNRGTLFHFSIYAS